ncbi:hypothetical protein ACFOTA_21080 [Chitinophaga sp. GCM10012297]|uniref:DoxX family membrane protein n=1 Tax=Chitinophaga chungangae TaxID=2821488 RepID=A0ABS3YJ63_9BACT|nr:hypothetical protein [Chitinophaga chungangae]MBO9154721.1 hypothetical protein [Chitinophaga chungangae]
MKDVKISRERLFSYVLLGVRCLLAWTLLRYGYAKLRGDQFHVTPETMELPLKNIDLFRLSWYMAGHEPFNLFIGISQIIVAVLLLWTRTRLIGAFASIPIWINILMWDITFMGLNTPFTIRIPVYLFLTFLVLWGQKEEVISAIKTLLAKEPRASRFPVWSYLLLPLVAVVVELLTAAPLAIAHYIQLWVK